jgi:hypothetical protein
MYPEYTNGMKSVEHCQRASAGCTFFVTKRGIFGLGNKSIQVGDVCAVLLGSDIPFLLRKERERYLNSRMQVVTGKRRRHELHSLYNFRGQAYVHGIMKYEGDIMESDRAGRIRLRDFHLISHLCNYQILTGTVLETFYIHRYTNYEDGTKAILVFYELWWLYNRDTVPLKLARKSF